jgi:hypothetical protein
MFNLRYFKGCWLLKEAGICVSEEGNFEVSFPPLIGRQRVSHKREGEPKEQ